MRRLAWLGLLLPGPAAAQESAIVFDPTAGLRAHIVYESTGTMQFVGFPGLPDSSQGAFASMVAVTRRVAGPAEAGWVVDVSYDSSRARYRAGRDLVWQEFPVPVAIVGPLRTQVDAYLRETLLDPPDDEWTLRLLRALRGVPDLVLPSHPLAAGVRWNDTLSMPYVVELPGDPPTVLNLELRGRATIAVDSVIPRAADTLAYVSVRAGLNPLRVDTAYVEREIELPVTVWGSIGSTLVWSSGWDTWVSGSATVRMHHRVETGPATDREITASSAITTRFRLRP